MPEPDIIAILLTVSHFHILFLTSQQFRSKSNIPQIENRIEDFEVVYFLTYRFVCRKKSAMFRVQWNVRPDRGWVRVPQDDLGGDEIWCCKLRAGVVIMLVFTNIILSKVTWFSTFSLCSGYSLSNHCPQEGTPCDSSLVCSPNSTITGEGKEKHGFSRHCSSCSEMNEPTKSNCHLSKPQWWCIKPATTQKRTKVRKRTPLSL